MKWKHLIATLMLVILCMMQTAYAAEAGVSISASDPVYTSSGITLTVETRFHDLALYNEQVALSYHIYDLDGNLILFENERIPVVIDEAGTAQHEVFINFIAIPELNDLQQAEVRFDLVDQKNVFWFSDNQNVGFQSASVLFDRANLLPADTANPETPFSAANVISALLCAAGWVAVLYFFRKYAKKKHNQPDE